MLLKKETGVLSSDIKAFLLDCFITKKMVRAFIAIVFYCVLSFSSFRVRADSCDTFKHPTYGIGKCIDQEQCPNSRFMYGLCESKPANIKCCFSRDPLIAEEFRAVWIATVGDMDWPSSNTAPPARQQQELIDILNTVQRLNMNVVIFHVIGGMCFVFNH
jgi:hypothetical protein